MTTSGPPSPGGTTEDREPYGGLRIYSLATAQYLMGTGVVTRAFITLGLRATAGISPGQLGRAFDRVGDMIDRVECTLKDPRMKKFLELFWSGYCNRAEVLECYVRRT